MTENALYTKWSYTSIVNSLAVEITSYKVTLSQAKRLNS